ncbi:hypothetical protein GCM10012288_06000 [Malaciobacter pacificus]|uniref:Uncharacterized protein n=1 Tax=Malaciobacter pacificus TaxID=1080223 RepID=A0A5C2H507_9BACT|nr:ribbon-helix-helix domain-containing protein [Malaciobacter pacificus]QEP33873.1 hypothetical protein APAC_0729 [Malaciobacter pacificus]GGD34823.1 hypothetical protein GCM10012288_06000 [Malaciobacter pacificus]
MYTLEQIEKQQVGLRLPKYLIEQIDELTKEYSLNRSEIITESIKAFLIEQKSKRLYDSFNESCKELKTIIANEGDDLDTLEDFINEIDN